MASLVSQRFLPPAEATSMIQQQCRKLLFLLVLATWLPAGSRVTGCGHFEPFTQQDLAAETLDCFVHLGIPPGRVQLYQRGVFPDDPGTWCLVRCVTIKLGLYRDRYGPDVGNLYEQFSKNGLIEGQSEVSFKQAAYGCIAALVDQYSGACERAYHMIIDCFGDPIRKLVESKPVAKNRYDPCTDCYRMFDELYHSTVFENYPCGKCCQSGKCTKKKKKY